jgi:hypothetical protein
LIILCPLHWPKSSVEKEYNRISAITYRDIVTIAQYECGTGVNIHPNELILTVAHRLEIESV